MLEPVRYRDADNIPILAVVATSLFGRRAFIEYCQRPRQFTDDARLAASCYGRSVIENVRKWVRKKKGMERNTRVTPCLAGTSWRRDEARRFSLPPSPVSGRRVLLTKGAAEHILRRCNSPLSQAIIIITHLRLVVPPLVIFFLQRTSGGAEVSHASPFV